MVASLSRECPCLLGEPRLAHHANLVGAHIGGFASDGHLQSRSPVGPEHRAQRADYDGGEDGVERVEADNDAGASLAQFAAFYGIKPRPVDFVALHFLRATFVLCLSFHLLTSRIESRICLS